MEGTRIMRIMERITVMRPTPRFLLIGLLFSCATLFMVKAARADWQAVDNQHLDYAFFNTGAQPRMYNKVLIDPLTVWYAADESQDTGVLESNVNLLRIRFQAAVQEELDARQIEVADEPGPGVLRLHVELVDLKINIGKANRNPWGDRFAFQTMPGRMTVVAELKDAQTGQVLFRLADLESESVNEAAVWGEVDAALSSWSYALGQVVTDIGSPAAKQSFAHTVK